MIEQVRGIVEELRAYPQLVKIYEINTVGWLCVDAVLFVLTAVSWELLWRYCPRFSVDADPNKPRIVISVVASIIAVLFALGIVCNAVDLYAVRTNPAGVILNDIFRHLHVSVSR